MRGTTPTHVFTLPFDTEAVKTVKVIYAYDGDVILEKETQDCIMESNTVSLNLTQEETILFENNQLIQVQLRVLLQDGKALRSVIYHCHTGVLLDDEVLV